jgi:general secretion pathway protein K
MGSPKPPSREGERAGSAKAVARAGSSRGIALISVLWITALLAVMAASFVSSSRTEARLARNQLENAKAQALADGGLQRAVLGLLQYEPERLWRADGRVYRLDLGEGDVQVTIRDEDGKIDINEGSPELLSGLFVALDLEPEAAATLAARIVDFRDDDSDPEPRGAEDPAYLAAGLAEGAADRPFVSEAELLRVLGMTEALYRRIKPHVTVHSGSDGVDPTRATKAVLGALPGITPEIIESLLNAGPDDDPLDAIEDDEVLEQIDLFWLPSREAVFTIRADGRTPGGGHFVREAVVELDGSPEQPFLVYTWRQGFGES